MFLYGTKDPFLNIRAEFGSAPWFYNNFCLMHLISTMFLIKDSKKEASLMGGFCYRILKPLGLSDLLKPIKNIFDVKLGKTTFGDYIKRTRSRLATHGDLSFRSLPVAEQKITFSKPLVLKFERLMEKLITEVEVLKNTLEGYIK